MGIFLDSVPLSAIVKIRDMMYTVKDPFRLDQGDVSFDAPETFKQAVRKALDANHTHYLPTAGLPRLRQLLVEKMRTKNGIPIELGGRGAGDQRRDARHLRRHARAARAWRRSDRAGPGVAADDGHRHGRARRAGAGAAARETRLALGPRRSGARHHAEDARSLPQLAEQPRGRHPARAPTSSGWPPLRREQNLWVFSDEAYEDMVFEGEHVSIASLPGMYERTDPALHVQQDLRGDRRAHGLSTPSRIR